MKPVIGTVVVLALVVGSVVWAEIVDAQPSWGQNRAAWTQQTRMGSYMPMADQMMSESPAYAAHSQSDLSCSHWYGRLIPRRWANWHSDWSSTGYHRGPHRCW